MAEIVVADAGPLIALGRLGRIDLLPQVFAKVIVPRTVFEETQVYSDLPDARAIVSSWQGGDFTVDNTQVNFLEPTLDDDLGLGEATAISLAVAQGYGVLIDDMHGRVVAATLKIETIGTVGVLLLARQRALIPALKPLLEQLVASGHYLSTTLVQAALIKVGE
ncbi:MAG: DUF3368 domain-containing protein [Burkholderiales bacterium]